MAPPLTKHMKNHGTTQPTSQSCRTSDTALPTHRIPLPQYPRRRTSANACNILCTLSVVHVLIASVAYMIEILTHELHICVPRHTYVGQPTFSTTANTLSTAQTAVCASNTSMRQPVCHATQTHSALPPFLSCANRTHALDGCHPRTHTCPHPAQFSQPITEEPARSAAPQKPCQELAKLAIPVHSTMRHVTPQAHPTPLVRTFCKHALTGTEI